MNEQNRTCGCTTSVGCNVRDCRYHTEENACGAAKINVSNESAQRKAETFCSTFENKAGK